MIRRLLFTTAVLGFFLTVPGCWDGPTDKLNTKPVTPPPKMTTGKQPGSTDRAQPIRPEE